MKKYCKKIALILTCVVSLGGVSTVATGFVDSQIMAVNSLTVSATDSALDTTDSALNTTGPSVTATPEITTGPSVTATPEITTGPSVTATPEITTGPSVTATPTPEPTVTPEESTTPNPEESTAPESTVTPTPESTKKPSSSSSKNNSSSSSNSNKDDKDTTSTSVSNKVTVPASQDDKTVTIKVNEVKETVKKSIETSVKKNTNFVTNPDLPIFEADVNAVDNETGVKADVNKPRSMTIDLSGIKINDPSKLTLVKYVLLPNGEYEIIKLGGFYDPKTQTFSGYIEGEGTYGVMEAKELSQITLSMNSSQMQVNNAPVTGDVGPQVIDDTPVLPLRAIAETLGADIGWNPLTKSVSISIDGKKIDLNAASDAYIKDGRTLVPLDFIKKNLGVNLRLRDEGKTIDIIR